jgi:hypothetical protein
MSTNTVLLQGNFTSGGVAVNIPLRCGIDWMRVYNTTQAAASQTTAIGVEYYWQAGFPAAAAWEYKKGGSANAGANLISYNTTGGFTYYDSSLVNYGVINSTTTAISTASIPVATNSGTNGLSAGQVVRILNQVGAPQFGGYDMTVGVNTLSSTTFSLDFMPQLSVAGTSGSWMLINSDPIFYPPHRYITAITSSGFTTLVTFSVRHNYTVGQIVRFNVSDAFGMTQINGLQGTILSVDNTGASNDIEVDIDSASFTDFSFPLAADYPFTPASATPVGQDTAYTISEGGNILADATDNIATIGIILAAGVNSPAGSDDDVIFWQAGTAFSLNTQAFVS